MKFRVQMLSSFPYVKRIITARECSVCPCRCGQATKAERIIPIAFGTGNQQQQTIPKEFLRNKQETLS